MFVESMIPQLPRALLSSSWDLSCPKVLPVVLTGLYPSPVTAPALVPALCQPGHVAHHVTPELPPPAAGAQPSALQTVQPLPQAQPGEWQEGYGQWVGSAMKLGPWV